jgi:hypothetical protein
MVFTYMTKNEIIKEQSLINKLDGNVNCLQITRVSRQAG